MVDKLKQFHDDLKAFRRQIKDQKVKQIARQNLRAEAERLGTQWFTELHDSLQHQGGMTRDTLSKYSDGFGQLLKLSAPNNLKNSYLEVLDLLIKPFRDELVLPAQKGPSTGSLAILHQVLTDLPEPEENKYLSEAVSCAQRTFFRAAVVLGWCAAIDRIHRSIQSIGFDRFNHTSLRMAGEKKGKFKKFNKPQNVNSLSELREVFDTVVLRVIEGMEVIDSNQYTRLRGCFDLRCQCAHPGAAAVTEFNLMSFFSDINENVFRNPKLML